VDVVALTRRLCSRLCAPVLSSTSKATSAGCRLRHDGYTGASMPLNIESGCRQPIWETTRNVKNFHPFTGYRRNSHVYHAHFKLLTNRTIACTAPSESGVLLHIPAWCSISTCRDLPPLENRHSTTATAICSKSGNYLCSNSDVFSPGRCGK
jgi:hypothetical protein